MLLKHSKVYIDSLKYHSVKSFEGRNIHTIKTMNHINKFNTLIVIQSSITYKPWTLKAFFIISVINKASNFNTILLIREKNKIETTPGYNVQWAELVKLLQVLIRQRRGALLGIRTTASDKRLAILLLTNASYMVILSWKPHCRQHKYN